MDLKRRSYEALDRRDEAQALERGIAMLREENPDL
jgi:hypothetical protein